MSTEQVHIWRRSYDIPPPEISKDSPYYPGHDRRYNDLKASGEIPLTEALKHTEIRFMKEWTNSIAPDIRSGKRLLIAVRIRFPQLFNTITKVTIPATFT